MEDRERPCNPDRLSVVEGLKLCELLGVAFDKVSELVDQPGAFKPRYILPPSSLECLPGRRNSQIDILRGGYTYDIRLAHITWIESYQRR